MMALAQNRATWYRRLRRLPPPLFRLVTGLQRDVLFLWVPKCAGTSVYATLVKYGCVEHRWGNPLQPFDNRGIITFGHVDTLQLIDAGIVTQRYFDDAFKFAFVRNPFDRLVSLFVYLKKISCEAVPADMLFEQFCEVIGRGDIPPIGLYNYRGLNQCNPMSRWLTDKNGRLIADFVGHHEQLSEDFQEVCRRLGIREKIPHENRTDHRPYRDYYTAKTRALIERAYQEDLDRFHYSF
jgi:hypothetical protein